MALFGLLGKKKREELLPGAGEGAPQRVGVPHEGPPLGAEAGFQEGPAFAREPSFSMPSVPAMQLDQNQLVLAKLDAIKALLDSVVQRLERIERLAQQQSEEESKVPRWR